MILFYFNNITTLFMTDAIKTPIKLPGNETVKFE